MLAVEQATLSLAELGAAGAVTVTRDEPAPQPRPEGKLAPGNSVSISLPAYERAFDAKLRLEAAQLHHLRHARRTRTATAASNAAARPPPSRRAAP